jgi:hypothetical protein
MPRLVIHRLRYISSFFFLLPLSFSERSQKEVLESTALTELNLVNDKYETVMATIAANITQFLCPFRRFSAAWVILHHLV